MDTMNNSEYDDILNEALDSRQPLDSPKLRELAGASDAHRRQWERYACLAQSITEWQADVPDADLVDGVLAAMRAEQSPSASNDGAERSSEFSRALAKRGDASEETTSPQGRRRFRSSRKFAAVAALTTAAVAVLLVPLFNPDSVDSPDETTLRPVPEHTPTTGVTGDAALVVVDQEFVENDTELSTLVQDAGLAYLGLATGTVDAFAEAAFLIDPREGYKATLQNAAESDHRKAVWTEEWERELKPIGRNFGAAFDFLNDVVPGERVPAT